MNLETICSNQELDLYQQNQTIGAKRLAKLLVLVVILENARGATTSVMLQGWLVTMPALCLVTLAGKS